MRQDREAVNQITRKPLRAIEEIGLDAATAFSYFLFGRLGGSGIWMNNL